MKCAHRMWIATCIVSVIDLLKNGINHILEYIFFGKHYYDWPHRTQIGLSGAEIISLEKYFKVTFCYPRGKF
jgi:hypothetical protein